MRKKILKWLEKTPVLYNIFLLLKYRHDLEYMRQVKALRNNPHVIELLSTKKSPTASGIVCDIEIGGPKDGFFALVRWTLDALYFCDCFSFIPVIRFSTKSIYFDPNMPSTLDPYDYYFKQPFHENNINPEDSKNVIVKYDSRNRLKAEMLNGGVSYQVSEKYMIQMARIMEKYLKFNTKTAQIVSEQLKVRAVDETVLGIHMRGTDYKSNYKNHPQYISPDTYYPYIDHALKKYGFKKIYIATDDENILQNFLDRYNQEIVIYDKNAVRGNNTQGVHTRTDIVRPYHRYMLGIEVICDMCTLAACGGLISGLSQVSLISRIYKISKNESFRYDKTIDKGINKHGKVFNITPTVKQ